jgi:hypothetical protein
MNEQLELCINCINCITYDKKYHCDYEMWTNKSLNDIILFIPVMFECENYEEYKGENKHIRN